MEENEEMNKEQTTILISLLIQMLSDICFYVHLLIVGIRSMWTVSYL